MRARIATLALMAAATALAALTIGPKPVPRLVWNASESVPMGLYGVQPAYRLIVTDLVVAFPPEPLATFLADGGYLPHGVPLIKRILALPEQMVCRNDFAITVDGIEMGAARERDRRGRPLPVWQGCRVVRQWRSLPDELGRAGITRQPLLRTVAPHGRRRPRRSPLDLRGGIIVFPRRNCPAVHLRRPAPLSAQILRAECIMVLNGTGKPDSSRCGSVAINASARHELSGRRAAVLRSGDPSWTS